jgi:hypothetical protein
MFEGINNYVFAKFEKGMCYICNQQFDLRSDEIHITSILDRINNKLAHSLSNCKPCCKDVIVLNQIMMMLKCLN